MTLADNIAKALKSATKDLHAEKKRRERDARTARRPIKTTTNNMKLNAAVFEVMEEAITDASGDGAYPFPTRNLMYAVRPLIQRYTDAELKTAYFSQVLVPEYERQHGRIPGMYRDPRGHLYEPHTGKVVPLGTREVADYIFPEYVFDKILYVEKEGLNPIFEAAQLADRFDMAIASGKGQPVEAVRALFERAEAGNYKMFVLHDADDSGYSIARTISEETARMPDYSVEVIDLGLTVDNAIDGIEDVFAGPLLTEDYTRKKELPFWMPSRLNQREREWFDTDPIWTSGGKRQWKCTRVELNALKSDVVAYVEAGLKANGAADKIVPPADVLDREAQQQHRNAITALVDDYLATRFDKDALASTLVSEFPLDDDTDFGEVVTDAHEADRATWWKTAINSEADRQVDEADDQLRDRLGELLTQQDQEEA